MWNEFTNETIPDCNKHIIILDKKYKRVMIGWIDNDLICIDMAPCGLFDNLEHFINKSDYMWVYAPEEE